MPRPTDYKKTVFILGAGFSIEAGGPPQSNLLKLVMELGDSDEKSQVERFLDAAMGLKGPELESASLEDIYTPIDRCLADQISFRGHNQVELTQVRDNIDYLLSVAIRESFLSSGRDGEYVDRLARFIVGGASKRADLAKDNQNADQAKKHDPVAVISLNWDLLLDLALNNVLLQRDKATGINDFADYDPFGVVDYCCYISSLEKADRRIRSGLWSLGAKGYNVKLLKIHGSLNWLQCTNCQRLFTAFNGKLIDEVGQECRHCSKHDIVASLRRSLIMPTFLKDFSNFQLKLVWQNAGVELMEASKLVFIGYSLPESDFEFRQLISRMIHRNAEIDVVLYGGADTYKLERQRYDQFFAGHSINHFDQGASAYVLNEVPEVAWA